MNQNPSPISVFSKIIHLLRQQKNIFPIILGFFGFFFGSLILHYFFLKFISYFWSENRSRLKQQSAEIDERFEKKEWIESQKQLLASRVSCILLFLVFLFYCLKMSKLVRIRMDHPITVPTTSTKILENPFGSSEHNSQNSKIVLELNKKLEGSSEHNSQNSKIVLELNKKLEGSSEHNSQNSNSQADPKPNSGGKKSNRGKWVLLKELAKKIPEIGIVLLYIWKGHQPGGSDLSFILQFIDLDIANRNTSSIEKIEEAEAQLNMLENLLQQICELVDDGTPPTEETIKDILCMKAALYIARRFLSYRREILSFSLGRCIYYTISSVSSFIVAFRTYKTFKKSR